MLQMIEEKLYLSDHFPTIIGQWPNPLGLEDGQCCPPVEKRAIKVTQEITGPSP